jgi:hypothetical protein
MCDTNTTINTFLCDQCVNVHATKVTACIGYDGHNLAQLISSSITLLDPTPHTAVVRELGSRVHNILMSNNNLHLSGGRITHLFWHICNTVSKSSRVVNIADVFKSVYKGDTREAARILGEFRRFVHENQDKPYCKAHYVSSHGHLKGKTRLSVFDKTSLLRCLRSRGLRGVKVTDLLLECDNMLQHLTELEQEREILIPSGSGVVFSTHIFRQQHVMRSLPSQESVRKNKMAQVCKRMRRPKPSKYANASTDLQITAA